MKAAPFYEMEGVDHVLFVFGGSMGSQALNEAMAEALNKLLSIDGLGHYLADRHALLRAISTSDSNTSAIENAQVH